MSTQLSAADTQATIFHADFQTFGEQSVTTSEPFDFAKYKTPQLDEESIPKKANGIRMPAASQVGAGMPIVASWEASVSP
jgi:hypothetical protein